MMYTKNSENKIYAYLLFFIWPFLSILIAFYDYRQSWAKNVVWLFVAFYAYTMIISSDQTDANRYRDQFIEVATSGSTNDVIFYDEDSDTVDLLKPFLDAVVSRFTSNYKILFLVYGLIFGFFFSRNLWLLLDRTEHPFTVISIILLILFALINPIWYINGFRFWTAAQIFVFGSLMYLLEGKTKGLLWAGITVFVHFSFMVPVAILIFYYLVGNRSTIFFYFFIASLFISELNLEGIRNNLGILPIVIENRVDGYTNEEYVENKKIKNKDVNWYVKLQSKSLKYSIYVLFFYLYWKKRKYLKKNQNLFSIFGFVLLFFGTANIISSIPSAGRFLTVAYSLSIAFIFLCVQFLNDKNTNLLIKISLPALLLFMIVNIRIGFDSMGLSTIFGNPLIAIFMEEDIPLINFIK